MTELFADDYPAQTYRRCGMSPWLDIARAAGLLILALALVVVFFRYWGGGDPHG